MWTKEKIIELLATSDDAVGRAIVSLNKRQTADERASQLTRHDNGRGFKPCHARMGTAMAAFYERTGFLTPKQVAYWRKTDKNGVMRIGCYTRQLLDIIKERQAEKQLELAA